MRVPLTAMALALGAATLAGPALAQGDVIAERRAGLKRMGEHMQAMKGVVMSFWNLTTTIGNLWVLLSNAAVRNDTVTHQIASTGLSEAAFLMFFFAGFAFLAALAFGWYAKRYRMVDNYRTA